MTVLEVLKKTANDLGDIRVRISDAEQIGNPIRAAVMNINACIDALEKAEEAQHAKEADDQPETV